MVCQYFLASDAPMNAGVFRPIEVVAPAGCPLNPRFPAAVGARGMMLWRITDLLTRALSQAVPGHAIADGEGGSSSLTYIPEQTTGEPRFLIDWYFSGWGARPGLDGVDGAPAIASGSGGGSASVEALESEHPVLAEWQRFVPDTGGPGQFRGAVAVSRRTRFLRDGRVILRTSRTRSAPRGLAGGGAGAAFQAIHQAGD